MKSQVARRAVGPATRLWRIDARLGAYKLRVRSETDQAITSLKQQARFLSQSRGDKTRRRGWRYLSDDPENPAIDDAA